MSRVILLVALLLSLAAAPATKPATKPSIKPAATAPVRIRDGMVNGAVRYMVPAEWDMTSRTKNGMEAFYSLPDGKGRVSMMVDQQVQGIPQHDPAVRHQLMVAVLGGITADLKNRKVTIIDAPKIERDDRFMLRIHERFKEGDAVIDATHCYRPIGLNMISIVASTRSEDPADAKAVQDAGALMLMSVTLGPPDKRIPRPVNLE